MRTTESVVVPAPPPDLFPILADLDRYPGWLRLVHEATLVDDCAWSVELRAQVGPFARSKRIRMKRSVHEQDRLVEFERAEVDGRQHARWSLRVELEPTGDHATLVSMHLAYDGALWTGGLLERVLDEEIRKGRAGLAALVSGEPTR
jgi:ribosome-associated toxin RatA of RatAB toxin-antitoxin module